MCEEESEDAEAVNKLLEINDSIHRTIERYRLMKAGDIDAANKIEKGTLGTKTGVGKNAANELSLIDFDPEPAIDTASASNTNGGSLLDGVSTSSSAPVKPKTVEDDLLGLSLDDGSSGALGTISLGPSTSSGFASGSIFASNHQYYPNPLPTQNQAAQTSPKPNYDAFASLTSALPSSKPATPVPSIPQQQRPASQTHIDPFAALVSASSRPSTPRIGGTPQQPGGQSVAANKPAPSSVPAEDDWQFESSLPPSKTIQVHSSSIQIEFEPRRLPGQSSIQITARFGNTTQQRITALHFQVAVEKSYTLQLKPQSGRELPPKSVNSVQQEIVLNGVPEGKGNVVKMRFKVSYELNGFPQEEQGTVPSLEIR